MVLSGHPTSYFPSLSPLTPFLPLTLSPCRHVTQGSMQLKGDVSEFKERCNKKMCRQWNMKHGSIYFTAPFIVNHHFQCFILELNWNNSHTYRLKHWKLIVEWKWDEKNEFEKNSESISSCLPSCQMSKLILLCSDIHCLLRYNFYPHVTAAERDIWKEIGFARKSIRWSKGVEISYLVITSLNDSLITRMNEQYRCRNERT